MEDHNFQKKDKKKEEKSKRNYTISVYAIKFWNNVDPLMLMIRTTSCQHQKDEDDKTQAMGYDCGAFGHTKRKVAVKYDAGTYHTHYNHIPSIMQISL